MDSFVDKRNFLLVAHSVPYHLDTTENVLYSEFPSGAAGTEDLQKGINEAKKQIGDSDKIVLYR
ncbi:MAG: hypothetical protein LLG44_11145 [Chloroflexi bacterium]|nr:hypothetical protein [Chloroflexota bacterium]